MCSTVVEQGDTVVARMPSFDHPSLILFFNMTTCTLVQKFLCFFFPIDLGRSCVCVVMGTTRNIYLVVFLRWQAVQWVFSRASSETYVLRFRDNFESYYDRGVIVVEGAALFTPPL